MTNPITERIDQALDAINTKTELNKKQGGVKWGRVVLAIVGCIYLTHYLTSQRINDELGLSRLNELTTEVNKLSSQIEDLDKNKQTKQSEVNEAMKLLDKRKSELHIIKSDISAKESLKSIKKEQIKKINTAIWYVKDAAKLDIKVTGSLNQPITGNNSSGS